MKYYANKIRKDTILNVNNFFHNILIADNGRKSMWKKPAGHELFALPVPARVKPLRLQLLSSALRCAELQVFFAHSK